MGQLSIGGRPPEALLVAQPARRGPKATEAPVRVERLIRFPDAAAATERLRELVNELFDLADARLALVARRERLALKLADPALMEHPKRAEAEARWEELWREHGELLARIDAQVMVIAKTYAALSPERRADLTATGWERTGAVTAVRCWLEGCLLTAWNPQGEVPF